MPAILNSIKPWAIQVLWQHDMLVSPIARLLNATDETEQNQMTEKWRQSKLAELSFVGLMSALITVTFVGAFAWYGSSNDGVRCIWFSGLIVALASIATVVQQSTALFRLSVGDDDLVKLRRALGYRGPNGTLRPRPAQLLLWQMPTIMLNVSIALFAIGLFTMLWSGREDIEVVIVTAIFSGVAIICYLGSSFQLHHSLAT